VRAGAAEGASAGQELSCPVNRLTRPPCGGRALFTRSGGAAGVGRTGETAVVDLRPAVVRRLPGLATPAGRSELHRVATAALLAVPGIRQVVYRVGGDARAFCDWQEVVASP